MFMMRFTASTSCKIIVAGSKDNVCEVIDVLITDNMPGVLGLVDADFDRATELDRTKSSSIVSPEYHDLEVMLLCSRALSRVLLELGSENKLSGFSGDVLDALVERSLPLGVLRLLSIREELGLKFQGLNYGRWIVRNSFDWSVARMIEAVTNNSQRPELLSDDIERSINAEIANAQENFREICCGTDMVEVLAIGLRGVLGNNSASEVDGDRLRTALRLAYTESDFESSGLRQAIVQWQGQPDGRRILSQDV